MTAGTGLARRHELAVIALTVLDVLPKPDQREVFTGWVSHAAGLDHDWYDYAVPQYLRNMLRRLCRMGLVERLYPAGRSGGPYWRLTQAGAAFEGTTGDLMRPIRGPR